MRLSTPAHLLTLLLMAALALPAGALAASGEDVIRDCAQDGDLDRDYSDKELNSAYDNLPSDIDEYSDCRDVILQAKAGGKGSQDGKGEDGSSGGGSGGGGGFDSSRSADSSGGATAEDQAELDARADSSRAGDAGRVTADGRQADADGNGSLDAGGGDGSGLPTPLIVAIVLVALAALVGGLYALRDRLPGGLGSRLPGSSGN